MWVFIQLRIPLMSSMWNLWPLSYRYMEWSLHFSALQLLLQYQLYHSSYWLTFMHRRRAWVQVLFLSKAELGFFHFLEIVTGWLVPSAGHKILVQPGWSLPPQKIPLAENRFLQAGKGAENTKEKSRAVL
jgi:hypothetical protein